MTADAEKTQPAMTREQWTMARKAPPGVIYGFSDEDEGVMDRHRMAAMCLYNRPFGFTQADVDLLRETAISVDGEWGTGRMDHPDTLRLNALAERVAALLPPK